ncbi:MAG: hypothetical protein ABL921_11595 [Pirellula sp.]
MIDSAPSYRCKISRGNSPALLILGWHKYKVDVFEVSRNSFSVRVPKKIAARVAVGSKSKLYYQEMLWSVSCTQKWISDEKQVELEFKQLEELTPPKLDKSIIGSKTKGVTAIQSDNTLPIAFGVSVVMAIMIMPAWGGQWGTSEAICTAVRSAWDALGQLVTGAR